MTAKTAINGIGWGLMVIAFAFFIVFCLYKNAEQMDKDRQEREDYIRVETTCQLSAGQMIDDTCYKSDKLEVIEVK